MSVEILGKGLSLDFGLDAHGCIKMSSYERSVEESIEIILSTRPGERVYNSDFGCRIGELMFEPNDIRTQTLAREYVSQALESFEPRINLIDINVMGEEENSMSIDIEYEIIQSNKVHNLVYPFYLLPQ